MLSEIGYYIRCARAGIKNLLLWFPIIWKDNDCDYAYLLTIMKFKISNMQAKMNGFFEGSEQVCADMQKVIDAMNRLIENSYVEDEFRKLHRDYYGNDGYTLDFLKNKQHNPEYSKKVLELAKKEDNLIQNDVNIICEIMKNDIRKWWY